MFAKCIRNVLRVTSKRKDYANICLAVVNKKFLEHTIVQYYIYCTYYIFYVYTYVCTYLCRYIHN